MDDATKELLVGLAGYLDEPKNRALQVSQQLDTMKTTILKLAAGDPEEPTTPAEPVLMQPRPKLQTEQALTLEWDPIAGATGYVVGRDGTDRTGFGAWVSPIVTATSHQFLKLTANTPYRLTVSALDAAGVVIGAGSVQVSTMPEPSGPVTPTDPPASGQAGRFSGLIVPSLVFLGGDADRGAMERRGRERGTAYDGVLTFPGRGSWAQMTAALDKAAPLVRAGLKVVFSMPHAPESEGDQMNAKGARNGYQAEQRKFAQRIVQLEMNTEDLVIRANWEFNGNWYRWSANRPGGPAALRDALNHFRDNVEAVAGTKIVWDLCCNKLPSQSGVTWREVLPNDGRPWVLGMDQYDHWGPTYNAQDWAKQARLGIALADDTARELGHRWSLDETGNSHETKSNAGGKDNPAFWDFMFPEVIARSARCAWINEYQHDGAPAYLKHSMPQYNPKAWQAYLKGIATLKAK